MRRFVDLLTEQSKLPIKEQREWASAQVEAVLARSGLNSWHLGDPVPATGPRTLIGIAAWSAYDLKLLDALGQSRHNQMGLAERIDILDIDVANRASGSWDYLEQIFPGIGKIYQTPIVGIWENGVLSQKASGASGRDLVISRYGLNRDQIYMRT